MDDVINFYLDDSGTRHPDHKIVLSHHRRDWFALGGVLIKDSDEAVARDAIVNFRMQWPQLASHALHSSEIRARTENFRWLLGDKEEENRFIQDLQALLLALPVTGLACVIDRPGYNKRYREKYGRNRWELCKTAFNIVVERAAKFAIDRNCRLRVLPEKCSKASDKCLKHYYEDLKNSGQPFDATSSGAYVPLDSAELAKCLYEFKTKAKSSPLAQIADLYLWPMCIGGYHKSNRPYLMLMAANKLIDCHYKPDVAIRGIKYSCFESVAITP